MTAANDEFREVVRNLHRGKDASYRNAWKKRGEVIGVLANIARKVDRLESVLDSAPATSDESLVDTAVDLFVYCIKYQTYLADLDEAVANALFDRAKMKRPYSDGPAGFDSLIDVIDLSALDGGIVTSAEAVKLVLSRFSDLESCFSGLNATLSAIVRLENVKMLTQAALNLIGVLRSQRNPLYRDFILANVGRIA